MQLKIDPNISYALALEGGGAKGAYQIGAWRALREANIRIGAVSGTSVGALNGAMIAMGDLEKAEEVWRDIRYSKVMAVDDEAMDRLIRGDLKDLDLRSVAAQLRGVLKNRGFDVAPLMGWMREVVDEDTVRHAATELYIVTYSLTDQKVLELRARDLADGELWDMLLASAYLPVFRNEPLGGKRYADGGVRDVLPLHVLVENGYRDIIALRLFGFGVERPFRIPEGTHVHTIAPKEELGGTLEFDAESSRRNMRLGYFDTLRFLYGLAGRHYYIDSCWDEQRAYDFLLFQLRPLLDKLGQTATLRELHENLLPAMARRLEVPKGDYRDIALSWLEEAARTAGVEQLAVYTETELLSRLMPEHFAPSLEPIFRRSLPEELLHRLGEAVNSVVEERKP